jgi:hypothetical protein
MPASPKRIEHVRRPLRLRALLIGTIALASGSARDVRAQAPPPAEKKASQPAAPKLAPFDLAYIPVKAKSIRIDRPAAMARRQRGQKEREDYPFPLSSELNLKVSVKADQVEQATMGLLHPVVPGHGFWVLRAVHDLDWKKRIGDAIKGRPGMPSDWAAVAFGGRTYFKLRGGQFSSWHEVCFYFPDPRTVVMADEECIRDLIRQPAGRQPELARGDGWQTVNRNLIAAAWAQEAEEAVYDEVSGMWMELLVHILPFKTKEPRRTFCGLGEDAVFRMTARFEFGDPRTATRAALDALGNLLVSKAEIAALRLSGQLDRDDNGMFQTMLDLASHCQVRANGRIVEIASQCKMDLDAVFGGEAKPAEAPKTRIP